MARRSWLGSGLALVVFAVPGAAQGRYGRYQERFPSVALMAGPAHYDFGAAGIGTGFAAALRFDVPSGRIFVVEPGVSLVSRSSRPGGRFVPTRASAAALPNTCQGGAPPTERCMPPPGFGSTSARTTGPDSKCALARLIHSRGRQRTSPSAS